MFSALRLFFANYFNFKGRSTRSQYWWPMAVISAVGAILYGLFYIALIFTAASQTDKAGPFVTVIVFLMLFFSLLVVIPSLSVEVRRLHDTGHCGWWFFASVVPCIGTIWLLVVTCQDSQPGDNKWGPNPKGLYRVDQIQTKE